MYSTLIWIVVVVDVKIPVFANAGNVNVKTADTDHLNRPQKFPCKMTDMQELVK